MGKNLKGGAEHPPPGQDRVKESPRKSIKFKHHPYKSGTAFSLQKRLQVIKSAILTHTEILTILSPIREAEGPENVRNGLFEST